MFGGNGSILNQCGGWLPGSAHSGTDFVGYNSAVRPAIETMTFSSPQTFFSVYIASSPFASFTFSYSGSPTVAYTMFFKPSSWTQMTYTGFYDTVAIESVNGVMQLDDLDTFNPSAIVTPEPGSLALFGTGLLGLAGAVVRRRRKRAP